MVIYILKNACPLCKGTVKGNLEFKYLCKQCNILFDKNQLIPVKNIKQESNLLTKKVKELHLKHKIKNVPSLIEKVVTNSNKAVEEKVRELGKVNKVNSANAKTEKKPATELENPIKIIVSTNSNKIHIDSCHFLKKIKKENWKTMTSLNKALKEGYEPCVCVRRKGLLKKK